MISYENVTLQEVREAIEQRKNRSAWSKGVNEYALELLEELEDAISQGYIDSFDHLTNETLTTAMLNGAKEWRKPNDEFAAWSVYTWGGSSLIYDGDIAERLCTPSELKKKKGGELRPNSREEWLDVQARALYQASQRIKRTASRINKGREA